MSEGLLLYTDSIPSRELSWSIPTVIRSRLRGGDVPSIPEARQLEAVGESVQKDLEWLEERLAQLTTASDAVKRERDAIRRYRDHHLGLLAPIRKLPVELLLKVFCLCCTSLDTPGLSITTDRNAAFTSVISTCTLNLAQTCSLWRSVVLHSPYLWAWICVDLTWRPIDVHALVSLYLRRSANWLITLHVEAFEGITHNAINLETTSSYCQELGFASLGLFEILLGNAYRWVWASFDLSLDVYSELSTLIDHWHGISLHNLRTLELRSEMLRMPMSIAHQGLRGLHFNAFFEEFKIATSLDTLRLPRLIPSLFLSLHQISTIEVMNCHTMAEIQHTLALCPELKTLKIGKEYGLDLYEYENLEEISSHSLETLTLSIRAISGLKLLPVLNLPKLTDFAVVATARLQSSLQSKDESTHVMADGLVVMLRRSPSLRSLELEGNLLSETDLLRVLSLTPELEEISISIGGDSGVVTSNLFDRLLLSPTQDLALVPHLVSFRIQIGAPVWRSISEDFSLPNFERVISMLESRSGTLRRFALCTRMDDSYNGDQWAKDCRREGWRLHTLRLNGMELELDTFFT
ncbi:hypothetical protein VKT23_007795 [Stygiomarasmius scandens]|uniref:F-box domain-containing protein n=1 Tax=Marasmiellus scandens TaxID=2682957 RepID=A0ABR1JKL2_9AGAR